MSSAAVPALKRKLRSYSRDELRAAIEAGARCVQFGYCFSLFHTLHGESDVLVVQGRLDAMRAGLWYTLGTVLFGWWGLYGVFLTPCYLYLNLCGGTDLTANVWAGLQSDALAHQMVGPSFQPFATSELAPDESPQDFFKNLENKERGMA